MRNRTKKGCTLLNLPKIKAISGNITSLNNGVDAPFEVKRIFFIYDIPSGEDRGAHAHKECHQLLIAITGSFEVEVFDGRETAKYYLNQPNIGLHIPPGIWASEINFSGGGICLVLASLEYQESDYIRDHREFLEFKIANGV
jgi:hypothetical protein